MKEPKFERRHMKAIAEVMQDCYPGVRGGWWEVVKTRMGDMLAKDNPRFDRGRFEEACEP